MNNLWEDYKAEFRKTNNVLIQFILVNISVFLVTVTLSFFSESIGSFVYKLIQLPGSFNEFVYQPWSIITYSFTHSQDTIRHIFWNMIGLYVFGRIIVELLGQSKLISLYFLGAVVAGCLFLTISHFFPNLIIGKMSIAEGNAILGDYRLPLVGASGSVIAIAVAVATLSPSYPINLIFVGPVKVIYIVAAYIFFSVIGLKGANAGGNYAHLGGAALGYIYVKQLQNGRDLGRYVFLVIEFFENLFKKKPKLKVSHTKKTSSKSKANSSTKDSSSSSVDQAEIDAILDKISQSGYESLSKEEKQKLFSASQKK